MKINRDYAIIISVLVGFCVVLIFPQALIVMWVIAFAGSLPVLVQAARATRERRVSIDTFNVFAVAVSFAVGEIRSATFIVLMLASARILDSFTESRSRSALEALLKLKPQTAHRERNGVVEEIPAENAVRGDIFVVHEGARVPVDGVVVFGEALINESTITGESKPIEKMSGDAVLGSTLNESGTIKIRATKEWKDSTIERMAELIRGAAKNKSRSEKIADRFAGFFLPFVVVLGAGTYFFTRNIQMTAAIFLVACADDMAVAIPLAITAALGRAAKRGVVIKGGEWLERLATISSLVIDKTGTLTFGTFAIRAVSVKSGVDEKDFWRMVAIAEKFSEHPMGRAIFREASRRDGVIPDPDAVTIHPGSGIAVRYHGDSIAVGDASLAGVLGIPTEDASDTSDNDGREDGAAKSFVFLNGKLIGHIAMGDVPRPEARESIRALRALGVHTITMFTGDNERAAAAVAREIGIDSVRAAMVPEDKVRELEIIAKKDGGVGMIGDGVNDAAALARADVGIAMGSAGAAVAVEAADIVVLNDNLARIPEMVVLSSQTVSIIRWDAIIWFVTNIVGFALVFAGVIGPAFAAFFNFATDFLPLMNSARLFVRKNDE